MMITRGRTRSIACSNPSSSSGMTAVCPDKVTKDESIDAVLSWLARMRTACGRGGCAARVSRLASDGCMHHRASDALRIVWKSLHAIGSVM